MISLPVMSSVPSKSLGWPLLFIFINNLNGLTDVQLSIIELMEFDSVSHTMVLKCLSVLNRIADNDYNDTLSGVSDYAHVTEDDVRVRGVNKPVIMRNLGITTCRSFLYKQSPPNVEHCQCR